MTKRVVFLAVLSSSVMFLASEASACWDNTDAMILKLKKLDLKTEQLKPGENTVALVVDNSGSMAYGEGLRRFDVALESLATAIPSDSTGLTAQHYAISDVAEPVETFTGAEPVGTSTSIADSLIDIIDSARSQSLAEGLVARASLEQRARLVQPRVAQWHQLVTQRP